MKIRWDFFKKEGVVSASEKDEMIRKTLIESEMKDLEYLTQQEELHGEHVFSPEFEQKMEQLFQKSDSERSEEKVGRSHSFRRIPKTAMAAVLAVMLIFIAVGVQTEAIPFPKFTYTLRKEEGAYAYLVEQEKFLKDTIEEKYEIAKIPKEYKLQDTLENKSLYRKIYRNEKGEECIYQQFSKSVIIKVDEVVKDYREMVFNESKYYIMSRNNLKSILWYANGYQYMIQVDLPVNDLVQMAKSIEIK